MRVCVGAGGTGGHLLPGLAVAKELRTRGHQVHFVVRTDLTSQTLLAKEGFASSSFMFAGFPRCLSWRMVTFPFLFLTAYFCARRILRRERPDIVLGMGGYVSVPVGLAAVSRGIPLVLHEQNSCAGLANRLLSRWARAVATSFETTENLSVRLGFVRVTGLPLRPGLVPKDFGESRRSLGLERSRFTLFIFGGSQGAKTLNRLVHESLPFLSEFRDQWQWIHLTGKADEQFMNDNYQRLGWTAFVRSYWRDMATLYSAADLVVSRAGANTVMELLAMGKRALLVPYPMATDNHQEKNARFSEKRGLAEVILERELTGEKLAALLKKQSNSTSPSPMERKFPLEKEGNNVYGAAGRVVDLLEEVCVV
jgi:UDP-N-acetylglucosamine--N-acetylmuramyl-(pentapeptide) pyrophosphoryl-undecaprenol N-acetylglucosamine transferase